MLLSHLLLQDWLNTRKEGEKMNYEQICYTNRKNQQNTSPLPISIAKTLFWIYFSIAFYE